MVLQEIQAACASALGAISAKREAVLSHRQPLRRRTGAQTTAVKLFNPRFEDDFAPSKDYDPDRWAASAPALHRWSLLA